jgi:hypothetical protein
MSRTVRVGGAKPPNLPVLGVVPTLTGRVNPVRFAAYPRHTEVYLIYLSEKFLTLKRFEISLSLVKYHFIYPSVKLLKHYVLRFEINTAKDKMKAIKKMRFFKKLKGLKFGIKVFNYYRKYIIYYIIIVKPLNQLKTINFRNKPIKERPRDKFAEKTTSDIN